MAQLARSRSRIRWLGLCVSLELFLLATGCGSSEEHGHQAGDHGGIIVPVGRDHFHAEALFTPEGELKLYVLGNDEAQVVDVESQTLEAYLRQPGDANSKSMKLEPTPQPGDAEGRTSVFTGTLPDDLAPETVLVVVPNISINEQRYRFSFTTTDPLMPQKITDEAERDLYLTAGGLYTETDIAANGSTTPSDKYSSFRSMHDSHPESGDFICPVTGTKANPACTWIVNGHEYQFCCPPCIDEFVTRAKEQPGQVKSPEEYVKQ